MLVEAWWPDSTEQHVAAKKFSFGKLSGSPMVGGILQMPFLKDPCL